MSALANRNALYGRAWRKARAVFLTNNPLCRFCKRRGRPVLATVVDHIKPHRGDRELFWDQTNWQGLCETCHNAVKQAEETSGHVRGADLDGSPIDPRHPWNVRGEGGAIKC